MIAFDHLRQKIILIVNMPLADVEVGYNKAVMELKQLEELLRNGEKKNEPGGRLTGEVTPLFNKRTILQYGRKGETPYPRGRHFSDRTVKPAVGTF